MRFPEPSNSPSLCRPTPTRVLVLTRWCWWTNEITWRRKGRPDRGWACDNICDVKRRSSAARGLLKFPKLPPSLIHNGLFGSQEGETLTRSPSSSVSAVVVAEFPPLTLHPFPVCSESSPILYWYRGWYLGGRAMTEDRSPKDPDESAVATSVRRQRCFFLETLAWIF